MHLSKWAYRADFVVYPALIAAAGLHAFWHATLLAGEYGLAAVCAGVLAWTALEYALHRWVLHRVPPFRKLHALHHQHPGALIGTPTWLSASLFIGLWAAVAHVISASMAGGLAAGLMTGYLVYVFVHDAVHHRAARPGSWLYRAKVRHALHHRPGVNCNFGVSSGRWDAIFGTSCALTLTDRCHPRRT